MILTKEIEIKITESNYKYWTSLGFTVFNGEVIYVPVALLSKGSHINIECQCDTCGVVKMVIYKNYLKYGNNFGEYYCRKCSEGKRRETLRKNYGVNYPIQNQFIKEKIKEGMSDRDKKNNMNE